MSMKLYGYLFLIALLLGFSAIFSWAADDPAAVAEPAPAEGAEEAEGEPEPDVQTSVGAGGEIIFEGMVITGKKLSPEFFITSAMNPTFPTVTFTRSFKDDILTPIDTSDFKEHVTRVRMPRVAHPVLWVTTATAITSGAVGGYMLARGEESWMYLGGIAIVTGGYSLYRYLTMEPEEQFQGE